MTDVFSDIYTGERGETVRASNYRDDTGHGASLTVQMENMRQETQIFT